MTKDPMSQDIASILADWKFDPEEICVRRILGDDGREKIQMRVELGVLQMEINGRPDGDRPESFESWLDYYEEKSRIHDAANPHGDPYKLQEADCVRLWREGVQYYHRYLSFWHLAMFELCSRDTARNLRLFAFVRKHADSDRHKLQFDQWRPYVTMMHTRAVATPLVTQKQFSEAIRAIESGIDAIRDFLEEYQQSGRASECVELVNLEQWRDEVAREEVNQLDPEEKAVRQLRRELDEAVAREEFEEAARLRDEIRRLTSGQSR